MTEAERIQDIIARAEQKIDGIIAELNLIHNIGVGAICYGEDLEPGKVDLRTFRVSGGPEDLTKDNATFEEWKQQLEIECAYKNIPVEICGGLDEFTEAYNEGSTPLDLLHANLDAA